MEFSTIRNLVETEQGGKTLTHREVKGASGKGVLSLILVLSLPPTFGRKPRGGGGGPSA